MTPEHKQVVPHSRRSGPVGYIALSQLARRLKASPHKIVQASFQIPDLDTLSQGKGRGRKVFIRESEIARIEGIINPSQNISE